jgi:signal transduction histidine kinase
MICSSLIGLSIINRFEAYSIQKLYEKANAIGMVTAFDLGGAIHSGNKQRINEEIRIAKLNSDVEYVIITDTQNMVIDEINPDKAISLNLRLDKDKQTSMSYEQSVVRLHMPIKHDNLTVGHLYLALSSDEFMDSMSSLKLTIYLIGFIFVAFFLFIIKILSNYITRPIKEFINVIDNISIGNLNERIEYTSTDEFGTLSNAFNEMLDRLELIQEDLHNEIDVRRITEDQLRDAQEEMAQALLYEKDLNQMKSNFVSTVSHEYRTPLTVIMSSTYLLQKFHEKGMAEGFDKQLQQIQTAVNSMIKLLDDVLVINRNDLTRHAVRFSTLEVIDFCKNISLRVKDGDHHSHTFEFISGQQTLYFKTDPNLLSGIVNGILSNAVKYSPADSNITIAVLENGNFLVIEVKDNGYGIPEADLPHIYESFYRGSNIIAAEGNGLGLTIIKRYVDLLQGKIVIDSKVNEGTTISIHIPRDNNFAGSEQILPF